MWRKRRRSSSAFWRLSTNEPTESVSLFPLSCCFVRVGLCGDGELETMSRFRNAATRLEGEANGWEGRSG